MRFSNRPRRVSESFWTRDLPVVFVVDQNGRAVAHPEASVAFSEKEMTDLKVVQDWQESGAQVQSALAPFSAVRDGRTVEMLGSYATAELDKSSRLGVIAIQDEAAALASVSDMRWQVLWISFIAALLTTLFGIFFAKKLTNPVQELAGGAHRIASGDFSKRIEVKSRTELGDLGNSFNMMTDQIERFIGDLQRSAEENRQLFIGTVKALAAAIDGKDPYTRGHSERVSRFSMAIAQRLGLSDEEVEKIRISALLHDVGKISIDDKILKKPAALTDEEYEIMKGHPQKGYKIMSQIPAMKEFLPGMYMHHEMVNGMGYPQGLKGDEIPLMGKIVAVADTFDAMTTDRPYQKAMKFEDALARIESFVGTRYDPAVVAAFSEACKEGQIKPGQVKLRKPTTPSTNPQIPQITPIKESLPCLICNPWRFVYNRRHMGLFWRRKKDEFVSLRLNEPAAKSRKLNHRHRHLRLQPVEPRSMKPSKRNRKFHLLDRRLPLPYLGSISRSRSCKRRKRRSNRSFPRGSVAPLLPLAIRYLKNSTQFSPGANRSTKSCWTNSRKS